MLRSFSRIDVANRLKHLIGSHVFEEMPLRSCLQGAPNASARQAEIQSLRVFELARVASRL